MPVWDGNINDITDFAANKYLQINSCGFQNKLPDHAIIRKKGRSDYHILLINSGMCKVLHKDKLYTLTAGNLVIYAPGEEKNKNILLNLKAHPCGVILQEKL